MDDTFEESSALYNELLMIFLHQHSLETLCGVMITAVQEVIHFVKY